MEIEKYIVERVNTVLKTTDARIVKRLEGGMSNYSYVVESGGKKYTYRVPGKFAEKFVDRTKELKVIELVDKLDMNNQTLFFDVPTGEKLAVYVEGTILSDTDVVSYNEKSVEALKRLHTSGLVFDDYDPFGRLSDYERYCIESGYEIPDEYKHLKARLEEFAKRHSDVEKVPCHCDYQPTNLVVSGDKMYVLDWEFAGMNDPFYDIACYGNVGFDKALMLLETYLGRKPVADEYRRLYFFRSFQCLQWFNVAMFKDRVGLSKDLNMDFYKIAFMFLGMAADLVNGYDKL